MLIVLFLILVSMGIATAATARAAECLWALLDQSEDCTTVLSSRNVLLIPSMIFQTHEIIGEGTCIHRQYQLPANCAGTAFVTKFCNGRQIQRWTLTTASFVSVNESCRCISDGDYRGETYERSWLSCNVWKIGAWCIKTTWVAMQIRLWCEGSKRYVKSSSFHSIY